MKKKDAIIYTFILSISFHSLLFLRWRFTSKHPETIKPIELSTIQSSSMHKGLGFGKKGVMGGGLSMKSLLPTPKELNFSSRNSLTQSWTGTANGSGGTKGEGVGDGLDGGWITSVGVDQYLPIMQYTQEVWQHIDKSLTFPKEFSDRRISGKVNVRLILNPDGTLTEGFKRVESDHALLEAYVLSLLLSILENPIVKKEHRPKSRIAMNMSFDFVLETERVFMDTNKGDTLSHALVFRRVNFVPSVIEKVYDQFFTSYFPPIFILGPAVYIDVIRAYQYVKNFGKPAEKELEKIRLEYLTQKLKMTIKKKTRR